MSQSQFNYLLNIGKMKLFAYPISLFMMSIIFYGCPYESDVPIDEPSQKINPELLGTWEERMKSDEIYNVNKHDEFTYGIEKRSLNNNKVKYYFAYTSIVNGTTFLNLWEDAPGDASRRFCLYKMDVDGDKLVTLTEVTENIREVFSSSDELKMFIANNMNHSYFYDKDKAIFIQTGKHQ